MKWVFRFLGIVGCISLYLSAGGGGARAQYFEAPQYTFQNITFDTANRGSYNSSDCLLDMLNCWEAVKPDMICFRWEFHASICSIVRDFCAESYGDQYNYNLKWNMAEELCFYESYQKYT